MQKFGITRALLVGLCSAALLGSLAGCAGTAQTGTSSSSHSSQAGRSGVEVFGTIDAGVSRTTNRSSR